LGYQQRVIDSGSKTATDGRFEPLQLTFSVLVIFEWLCIRYDHSMKNNGELKP
jgi:hypothetical protein